MVGEEKRHQMMQNLFGDQSEEEEEEEVESEHESNRQPSNASEEGDGGQEPEGEGEIEGQGEADMESEDELKDVDHDHGESEGEREQSSQEVEVEVADQREESEEKESASDEKAEYFQRDVTSRRHDTVNSGSERSEDNNYADNEEEEVNESRTLRSPSQEADQTHLLHSAPELRNVFGDSDDEEQLEYRVENQMEEESNIHRSPVEKEESYDRELKPEDMLADEEGHYGSEEEQTEAKTKEKPVGPPLELEIPLRPPPALPEKMHMIKVSNIMGIDPKPFDPKTYVEEDHFETDESGSKRRIRLGNNIVRWRKVKNPDGSTSIESNARFVRWSDGSLQLLIGNEVLEVTEQDAQHDQAHLFLRHGKGILQSQGRILKKMRFMPSSLSSKSHRLLTALVESRHRKGYRVKNCITDIDPEREKEQKERAESQTIRANELLNRKKEKVNRKYTQPVRRERQLSPGFLEDALDEEDESDYDDSRRSVRRRVEEDLEVEARAEKRIMSAKKGHKDIGRKSSVPLKSSRQQVSASDNEQSEYETEDEEDEVPPTHDEDIEPDWEEEEEHRDEDEEEAKEVSEEESEVPKKKRKESSSSLKRNELESDEDSPPRKAAAHRRMAIVYDSDDE